MSSTERAVDTEMAPTDTEPLPPSQLVSTLFLSDAQPSASPTPAPTHPDTSSPTHRPPYFDPIVGSRVSATTNCIEPAGEELHAYYTTPHIYTPILDTFSAHTPHINNKHIVFTPYNNALYIPYTTHIHNKYILHVCHTCTY